MRKRKNIAAIMAAGKGIRAGTSLPKQYEELGGRLVLERAVDAFEHHPGIDQVVIVADPDEMERVQNIIQKNAWKKITGIVKGGKVRYQSSWSAINTFSDRPQDNLIFHDAARPLVSARIISEVVEKLEHCRVVGVSVPVSDTLFFTGPGKNHIVSVPDRNLFQRAQTPQGFRISVLSKAYEYALKDLAFKATDDCGVVKKYLPGEKILLVTGDEKNMKITYPGDLEILRAWIG
ncbi:MAG: 2-C-methyl-D-erythritol 4-phosphate cytidylyltransferase [Bacteroidales bacterium]|nr:2-C-methyl-D-erythritol 4-phosphate cytidylyltransferase [Bacteroidales bacterium]MDD4030055.1 2-C-methyl-D-erythritol 4-phosphate cytidylyltransferase [Bacteroidales bacterium]MDD4436072.1 2-C-methyl-D-erythritol 4-phosphate cytidylyltransferase [Bacteroidales bacterium]MDD5732594.1 2-C-methyl-D-erythritol 4-phosphate cytidylyltransferase [Bacteroidales bacterium]